MTYLKSFKEVFPGRKIDAGFLVFDGLSSVSNLRKLTELGGEAVVGPVKLAQQVILRLLSATDTYRYEDTEQSTFATSIKDQSLNTVADITRALETSISELQALFDNEVTVKVEAGESIPLDEQLSAIVIKSVKLKATIANVSLDIITRAGSSFQFIAPVRIA